MANDSKISTAKPVLKGISVGEPSDNQCRFELDGKPISNSDAMYLMRERGYIVPTWLEREVRTGMTLAQRRERRAMSGVNHLREWK